MPNARTNLGAPLVKAGRFSIESTPSADLLSSSLPCALIDRGGCMIEVSPGLLAFAPDSLGRPMSEAFGISEETDREGGKESAETAKYGSYHTSSGEIVPVVIQFAPISASPDKLLAVFSDGKPFRDAEAAGLDASPDAALRVDVTGKIVFANTAATRLFGAAATNAILGLSLRALAARDEQATVIEGFGRVLLNELVPPLAVTFVNENSGGKEPLWLILMPDPAPNGRVLGVVAIFRSRKVELARNVIKQIALKEGDWRCRLRKVLQEVQCFVPFDLATFGIYAENITLFRPVHIEPSVGRLWPALWMVLSDGVLEWLNSGKTWEDDLDHFTELYPSLKNDPVVLRHHEYGIRSFVTLPVIGRNGPTSSLSLASVNKGRYGPEALAVLEDLDLAQVLMIFERELVEERRAFCLKMGSEIRTAGSLKKAGEILVSGLRDFFKWDHVSLIAIDRNIGEFKLVCQSFEKGCGLPPDFRQPIRDGMLGATLDANPDPGAAKPTALIIEDTRPQPRKFGYTPINDNLLSGMTCPIRLCGDWRWIINVEATVTNAFHGPDLEAMREILSQLEAELERLYRSELNRVLLAIMPEGVVVVGPGGVILSANRAATDRILGRIGERHQLGRLLDYAGDDTTADILRGALADTSRRLTIRGSDGRSHIVLATRYDLSEEYQSAVWFFTDLDNIDWNVEYRYLRAVVNDVAQQTRGPLMLASTLMMKAVEQLKGVASIERINARDLIVDAVTRTLAEINKADITFERLAESLSAIKEPIRERVQVDLRGCILDLIAGLPQRDVRHIELCVPDVGVFITGDVGRLRFALRSILGYLLRCRAGDDITPAKVGISLKHAESISSISMAVSGMPFFDTAVEEPTDQLWRSVSAGRDDASLGFAVVEAIIKAHGGTLAQKQTPLEISRTRLICTQFLIQFSSTYEA